MSTSCGDDVTGTNNTSGDETNNDTGSCIASRTGDSNDASWECSLRPIDETSFSISPQTPSTSVASGKLLSNSMRPTPIASHNRSITPHTASLINLFSRPTTTPITPTTPNFEAFDDNPFYDSPKALNTSSMPEIPNISSQFPPPCFSENTKNTKQQNNTLKRNEKNSSKSIESSENEMQCSWAQSSTEKAYNRQNTPVIENTADSRNNDQCGTLIKNNLTFPRQQTAMENDGRHNRDNTLMAHNLTAYEKKLPTIQSADDESGFSGNRNECICDESTPMIKLPSSHTPHSRNKISNGSEALLQLFQPQNESLYQTSMKHQVYSTFAKRAGNDAIGESSFTTYMTPIDENNTIPHSRTKLAQMNGDKKEPSQQITETWLQLKSALSDYFRPQKLKTTLVGAFLFALYQLVFSFAEASAITRPSHPVSSSSALLAPMALMACVGSLITCPMFIALFGSDFPALYPCLDMFMAPFLAKLAADVDESLVAARDSESTEDIDDSAAFLATFVALNAFGMLLSGVLCVLAAKIKLVNLAAFLPFPVLCGFFSSVGISVWMSAFKVDTGITIQRVLGSGNIILLGTSLLRHIPSLVVGSLLYILGPRSPFFLIGLIAATVVLAYSLMALTETSLEEAQGMGLFWKKEEVMMTPTTDEQKSWGPPQAFGLWSPSVIKNISWPAFANGLSDAIAMSLIYLLRCSLHAAALKKNLANVKANCKTNGESFQRNAALSESDMAKSSQQILVQMPKVNKSTEKSEANNDTEQMNGSVVSAKARKPKDVLEILMDYANGLFVLSFSGGFAVLPAIALGGIFSKFGAESKSPQYTAVLLLFGCYLSDFELVSYVPKCTFSSLLVLAAIDLVHSWFMKSFQKSVDVFEWFVVPFIVVAGLTTGMLESVGMGIAASTLIFVHSFHQAGVVKFLANGLTVRSTIERNCEDNEWLDQNADLIQVLVLQNYLFFGNATSCLNYISSMFDDDEANGSDVDLPPVPKYIIIDMSIVTGIDTSAVDVLVEISSLCSSHKCQLIFAGVPRFVRPALMAGGVKPSRVNLHLSYAPDLEAALGKAEDELLKYVGRNEEKMVRVAEKLKHQRRISMADFGFRHALQCIDDQHGIHMASHLKDLEKFTTPKDLKAGDQLNEDGTDNNLPRGLYFVESGLLKCEHDSSASLTRGRRGTLFATAQMKGSTDSIGQLRARSATVGRGLALLKGSPGLMMAQFNNTFRLARIGPGWVIGSISEFTGQDIPGTYTCMTACRVHHLSFDDIAELETTRPSLMVRLYKLLSHLMARRQEMTIGQLSTLRSIMSANAPTKPISRRQMATISKAMKVQS
mmetsp:Transcript_13080/g.27490  ORF Transcript_13080/g.27490 Transcript_13080/m.27490 type:complete len:1323 (+) Transcript_13080:168-4136(+)